MSSILERLTALVPAVLAQLAFASVVGAVALALVWVIAALAGARMSARTRCWLYRLAFAKMLAAFFIQSTVDVVWSPTPPPAVAKAVAAAPALGAVAALPAQLARPGAPRGAALAALWLAGALAGLAVLAVGFWRSRRMRTRSSPLLSGDILVTLHALSRDLGFARPPALASTPSGHGPMLAGLLAPTVLIPEHLVQSPPANLRLMLAHELAHHARGDLAWNALPALARALFFFHPLVWLGLSELTLAQEVAADELAIAVTQESLRSYGELLLSFVSVQSGPLAAMHASGSARFLKRRLQVLGDARGGAVRSRAAFASLALVSAVALVPLRFVKPEPDIPGSVSMAIKDAEVLVVAETIAVNAHFVLLVHPRLEKQTISVNLREVAPLEGLRSIALGIGARVVRMPTSEPPVFLLLPEDAPDPVTDVAEGLDEECAMALKDASAMVIIETIVINCGGNFVVGRPLTHHTVSVNFAGIKCRDALNAVLSVTNYKIDIQTSSSGRPTYILHDR